MNNIDLFNNIIDYIESHLAEDIDMNLIAQKANMSVYEFRRIFSFISGFPVSEYIRKRRLSVAGDKIASGNCSVTEAAVQFGYDAPSSFSRAFKAFHGFSPNDIHKGKNHLRMFTKIGFEFGLAGGSEISYKIDSQPEFYICGISGVSDMEDTECCENVWNQFYNSPLSEEILKLCGNQINVSYENAEHSVKCHIGARRSEKTASVSYTQIPAATWACFTMHGAEDAVINQFYGDIIFKWLESSDYNRDEKLPNLEVFPVDMTEDSFLWEIRIPVVHKNEVKNNV